MIYSIRGGGGLQHGLTAPPPNPPAAKFASQGDAPMRTDTQIKLLYYPLFFERVFLYLTGNYLWLTDTIGIFGTIHGKIIYKKLSSVALSQETNGKNKCLAADR